MRSIIESIQMGENYQMSNYFQQKMDTIHEDIHWMFLIAGNCVKC